MSDQEPSIDQWQRLYEAAGRVKEMAPWQWMFETDLFAVQHPQTGEVGFVSVMGQLGEHLAVACYPGAAGFHSFWRMATDRSHRGVAEEFFVIPQLQASFEDRAELNKRDREVIQSLGLKFRGKQSWPLFRSYRPGYLPWHLEAAEAEWLYWILDQLLVVAPSFKGQVRPSRADIPREYRLRVPSMVGDALSWHEDVIAAPDPPTQSVRVDLPPGLVEAVQQIDRGVREIEVDVSPQPFVVGERGQRPLVPFLLLAVEPESGFIICTELLTAESGVGNMYGEAPAHLLAAFVRIGFRPLNIAVRNWRLAAVLSPLAPMIGAEMVRKLRLPALQRVSRELDRFSGRR